MKTKELIQRLRDKDDQLCFLAEVEREKLLRRYEELGRSYDAMSNDLLCLFEELPIVPEKILYSCGIVKTMRLCGQSSMS